MFAPAPPVPTAPGRASDCSAAGGLPPSVFEQPPTTIVTAATATANPPLRLMSASLHAHAGRCRRPMCNEDDLSGIPAAPGSRHVARVLRSVRSRSTPMPGQRGAFGRSLERFSSWATLATGSTVGFSLAVLLIVVWL